MKLRFLLLLLPVVLVIAALSGCTAKKKPSAVLPAKAESPRTKAEVPGTKPAGPAARADLPEKFIWAVREWERIPFKNDPARTGLEHLTATFYSFPARVLAVAYEQTVDPAHGDAPVDQGYGDRFMRFIGVGRWGWSFETFFVPEVTAKDGSEPVRVGVLRALNTLECEGNRIMADFVWPLLKGGQETGSLVLRCVVHADEPAWLYGRVFLVGGPELVLKQLQLGSFGGSAGAAPPGARQWLAGTTKDEVEPSPGALPLEEYWMLSAHKVGYDAYLERRGSAGIFLPEGLSALNYRGNGSVSLVPRSDPGRVLCFALSDFAEDAPTWIARLRKEAPARRQRLATLDWQPNASVEVPRIEARGANLVDGLGEPHPLAREWSQRRTRLAERARAAQAAGLGSPEEQQLGQEIQSVRLWIEKGWPPAVTALIESER